MDTKPFFRSIFGFLCVERGFYLKLWGLNALDLLVTARWLGPFRILGFLHRILCALDGIRLAVGVYFLNELRLPVILLIIH